MKTFTYHVAGQDFTDTEAFGDAWRKARAVAIEKGCGITRTVVSINEEFYSYGAFLRKKDSDFKPEDMYIFSAKDETT